MKTPNSGCWSELPIDILRSLFELLSFVDFHRAKIVCLNWHLCSKQTVPRGIGSPWLMLFPKDDCVLFNPDENRVYKTKRDFTGTRFLANSGNWFLVIDSGSNLYIIDVFSEKRIDLPPIDSIKGSVYSVDRVGDMEFKNRVTKGDVDFIYFRSNEDLRGFLWVDKNKEEYTVAWFFDRCADYIAFCKNGEDHYHIIPTRIGVRTEFLGISDLVLRGDILYVYTTRRYIRLLDLSGQDGFKDVSNSVIFPLFPASRRSDAETTYDLADELKSYNRNIAVTTSGEVLLVESFFYDEATSQRPRIFRLYKKDPNPDPEDIFYRENLSVEVDSLGDEALLLDLGITVPADHTLGIEPDSIYFTRHDRVCYRNGKPSCPDICVFNLATKKLTRFPSLSYLNSKDARWFIPS